MEKKIRGRGDTRVISVNIKSGEGKEKSKKKGGMKNAEGKRAV